MTNGTDVTGSSRTGGSFGTTPRPYLLSRNFYNHNILSNADIHFQIRHRYCINWG